MNRRIVCDVCIVRLELAYICRHFRAHSILSNGFSMTRLLDRHSILDSKKFNFFVGRGFEIRKPYATIAPSYLKRKIRKTPFHMPYSNTYKLAILKLKYMHDNCFQSASYSPISAFSALCCDLK